MPVEYRCDGACRRILSDLPPGEQVIDEGERKYCQDDYTRLTKARAQFNARIQNMVDQATSGFQRELWDYTQPPLLDSTQLTESTEKLIALQPTNIIAVETGQLPPIRMPEPDVTPVTAPPLAKT